MTDRHDTESQLASLADGGVIVEVGCGVGNGLLALLSAPPRNGQLVIYGVGGPLHALHRPPGFALRAG